MSRNVFVFSNTPLWDIHYAEAVEIALNRNSRGDKVYFYQCRGELLGCPANPNREESKCVSCIEKSSYVIEKALPFAQIVTFENWSQQEPPDTIFESGTDSLEHLESLHLGGLPIGGLVASQVADDTSDGLFDPSDYQTRIRKLLDTGYRLFSCAKDFFSQQQIDVAYVWNGRRVADGPVVYAAKVLGREFRTFISGPTLGTYIEPRSLTVQAMDYQKAGLANLKESVAENPDVRDLVIERGNHFFTNQRSGSNYGLGLYNFSESFADSFSPGTSKPVLSIFPSCGWEKTGQDEFRNGVYDSEYDALEILLEKLSMLSQFEVVVRWHPNLRKVEGNERARIKNIHSKFLEDAQFIEPSSSISTYSLIEHSELVVTFGSTVGVEACYYGKPSICIGPAIYDGLAVAHFPKTSLDVEDAILNYENLGVGDYMDALIYGAFISNLGSKEFKFLALSNGNFFYENRPLSKPKLGVQSLFTLRWLKNLWYLIRMRAF